MSFSFAPAILPAARWRGRLSVWPGVKQRLHGSFEDPAAFEGTQKEKLAKFRQIRDQTETRVRAWLKEQGVVQQKL